MDKDQDYQIFIGLGNSRIRKYFIKRKYIPKIINLCTKFNLGFTIMDALGGYAKDTSYVVEYSLVVLIAHVSEDTIRAFAENIREVLGQDSVLLRKVNAQTEFITQS